MFRFPESSDKTLTPRDRLGAALVVLLFFSALILFISLPTFSPRESSKEQEMKEVERAFIQDDLITNTAKSAIPLEFIVDGGVGKDGIPALHRPKFTTILEAKRNFEAEAEGIVLSISGETRFYPFAILLWHEVVNDLIGGEPVLVTYCPLCASAIVFDPRVGTDTLQFGVSGKLYESNLLMYDRETESLWSQVLGEGIVGDMTGVKLELLSSQVISLSEFERRFPKGMVLSTDTGFRREYGFDPYADYDVSDEIYFPLSFLDQRLPPKEIVYVASTEGKSIALKLDDLKALGSATISIGRTKITAKLNDGSVEVRDSRGRIIPGYFAMWFSVSVHHRDRLVLWTKEGIR